MLRPIRVRESTRAFCTKVALGISLSLLCTAAPTAMADVVTDWNQFAESLQPLPPLPGLPPPVRSRAMAITQVAVHDALNSIKPRYESYTDVQRARRTASPDVAVSAAARTALVALIPSQTQAIMDFYVSKVPSCTTQACLDGVTAGEAAANAILLARNGDGSTSPHLPYNLAAAPGVYQPTPPTTGAAPNPAVQFAGWALVKPFVLKSASQFRAEPPKMFDLTSLEYARDYNEVKRLGALTSAERTTDQSDIARFWPGGGANINTVARLIVADRGLDLWQHARLFALINMAISDSAVSVFDTKYTYNFWRPVTAIRAGDTDGNAATEADTGWLSYQNTPPYPDYTCGLPNNVASGMEVLRRYFRTDYLPYTQRITAGIAAGLTRSFSRLAEAEAEAVNARVYGGMHFRTGCERAKIQGRQVGRFVIQHALRPLDDDNHGHGHGHGKDK
jgi:hypothetical protein